MTNVDIVKSSYDAFARGDLKALIDTLDPEVEWTMAEGFPYAGTYRRHDTVLNGVFKQIAAEWSLFTATMETHIESGDVVVTLGTYKGTYKTTERSFTGPFARCVQTGDMGYRCSGI